MNCSTPITSRNVAGPGEPGGTLPAGGEQWSFLQFNGTLWVPSWVMPEVVTAPETGEVLIVTGASEAAFQTPVGKSLLYRNAAQSISTTNIWLHQWSFASAASTTPEDAGFAVALRDGNLRWLVVTNSTPVLIADSITYTVVVGGVDTLLTTTLNTDVIGPSTNLETVVPVVAGDIISMRASGATANRTINTSADFFLEY